MSAAEAVRILSYLSVIGTAALIGRLFATGLFRRFPAFVSYLGVALVRIIILAAFFPDVQSSGYVRAWTLSEPVILVLQLAMVLEIYRRIGEYYRNLGSLGRRILVWLSVASAIICMLSLGPDLRAADWTSPFLQFVILVKRAEAMILAGVLLLTIGFYKWMDADKSPNVKRHALIASLYFSELTCYSVAVDIFKVAYWPATAVHLGLTLACLVTWTLCLSRRGEIVIPGPPMSPERIQAARAGWALLLQAARAINGYPMADPRK
jgi:hypothetical protein